MSEARIERVVSSPMLRCTKTAKPAAERAGVRIETDDRLIEIAHGTWEGRFRDEIAANDPVRYRAWREAPQDVAFEGGETVRDVLAHWRAFAGAPHPPVPTLVVTHDAVVRVALCEAQGGDLRRFWDARVENGAYAVFDVEGARWTLVDACVTDHLGALRAHQERQAL
jgi:broad specificity phosphatase PhoE